MSDVYSALNRVQFACSVLQNDWLDGQGARPGADVTLFRALRELHRVLGQPEGEAYDPHRLVRATLFHGLSETDAHA